MEKIYFQPFIYIEGQGWKQAVPHVNNTKVQTFIYLNIPVLDQYQYPNTILSLRIVRE